MARISEVIFPRVTGLVITCDSNGKPDIATFSFLMPVSFEPKYVAFSVSPRRKTFENLREMDEFVLAIPSREMLDKVWGCGIHSGRDVDKFSLLGLEKENAKVVKPPLLKNIPVQLECKVEFIKEFGDHYLVVGKVLEEHIAKLDFQPLLHYSKNIFFIPSEKITVE
jgi:flavin reductase (DIM6/NTAB) family NADH-FMN oxidoreductase RutF